MCLIIYVILMVESHKEMSGSYFISKSKEKESISFTLSIDMMYTTFQKFAQCFAEKNVKKHSICLK